MKRNKKLIIIGFIIIVVALIAVYVMNRGTDSDRFADEYNVDVSKDISIVYLNDANVMDELSSKDKVVFLGSSGSDDAVKAASVFLEAAKNNGVDKIYYYDLAEMNKKDKIVDSLKERLNVENITNPTLLLVKDKKVSSISEGYNKNTKEQYSDIMLEYILCTNPDC